jgi:tetratricopeptide (TPR) repeat protein
MHQSLASVYAYKSELDAWVASRSAKKPASRHNSYTRHRFTRTIAIAVLAVAIAVLAIFIYQQKPVPAKLAFEARDWILITRIDNRTGNDLFDGTLEYSLQSELSNSPYVNVVSRERIADTLARMKLPRTSPIDTDIGREISIRDGGIKAMLSGRIEQLGGTYVFGTELIEPGSGVVYASFSSTAANESQVVVAIHELSNKVRAALGEVLKDISSDPARLEKATTTKLRALQLYTRADALMMDHNKSQARELLEQAVAIDPEFASAHVLLGYILADWGEHEQSTVHLQKAMDFANTTTERERGFIEASYYKHVTRDVPRTLSSLELLQRTYPDHYWAATNLEWQHNMLGQPLRALPYAMRRADLRPNNYFEHINLIWKILAAGKQPEHLKYLERANMLAEELWQQSRLRAIDSQQHWLDNDVNAALAEMQKLLESVRTGSSQLRPYIEFEAIVMYLTLGQFQDARVLLNDRDISPHMLALLNLYTGMDSDLTDYLAVADATYETAILFARSGRPEEAERLLSDSMIRESAQRPFLVQYWEPIAMGEVALARGQQEAALGKFDQLANIPAIYPTPYYFMGIVSHANALEALGDVESAIKVLERAAVIKRSTVFWPGATMFWMNSQAKLIELYRKSGESGKAADVEAQLRSLLALADADHPVLRALASEDQTSGDTGVTH